MDLIGPMSIEDEQDALRLRRRGLSSLNRKELLLVARWLELDRYRMAQKLRRTARQVTSLENRDGSWLGHKCRRQARELSRLYEEEEGRGVYFP